MEFSIIHHKGKIYMYVIFAIASNFFFKYKFFIIYRKMEKSIDLFSGILSMHEN